MAKVRKLQHSLLLRYSTAFPENMFQLRMWLSCVPRAPVIPTSKFSGVLNTMVKVWKLSYLLSLRYPTAFPQNTFLLRKWLFFIPRALEIPPVPEQRCLEPQHTKLGKWTYLGQWTPLVLEQRCLAFQYTQHSRWTYFGWWTPSVLEQRCLEYPTAFPQNTFLLRNWLSFISRALEIPTSKFSGVLNTMVKVWKL